MPLIPLYNWTFSVIVISGGNPNQQSVEAFNLDGTQLCTMAALPDERRYHTMDGGFLCGGADTKKSCLHISSGGWSTFSWSLKKERQNHVSWDSSQGLILMGNKGVGIFSMWISTYFENYYWGGVRFWLCFYLLTRH